MSVDIEWDEMVIPMRKGYIKYVREFVRNEGREDNESMEE